MNEWSLNYHFGIRYYNWFGNESCSLRLRPPAILRLCSGRGTGGLPRFYCIGVITKLSFQASQIRSG